MENVSTAGSFWLGDWLIKPAANEVVRNGKARRVEHKVMRLLVFLVAHPGRDLSKAEILRGVWGAGVHSEEVLTVAVSSLRKALEDNPRSPRFIKTVPRYGYHMLLPATVPVEKEPPRAGWRLLEQRVGLRFLIIAVLVGLLLVVVLAQIVVELVYLPAR